jgi:hypothetical protein
MIPSPLPPLFPSLCSQRISKEAVNDRRPDGQRESENWGILHRTGPHVWTDSVLDWMHRQGIGFHEALVPGWLLPYDTLRLFNTVACTVFMNLK